MVVGDLVRVLVLVLVVTTIGGGASPVVVVGVVGAATLIFYAIGLQVLSRDSTMANTLATAKIEELRMIDGSDPRLAIGGDLDSNVADHFDTPTGFTRRWVVAAGPADTLDVTLRAIVDASASQTRPQVEIQVLLRKNTP